MKSENIWLLTVSVALYRALTTSYISVIHRKIEKYNSSGWKRPYASSSSNPTAMGRDIYH